MYQNKSNTKCGKLTYFFLCLILICSFISQLIVTQGYQITVQHITLEVRGADLTMDLYRPAKVTEDTKLPCMILSHGGSECMSADSIHAWEYARRGYVVLNVNMYGAGTADMPDYFEDGKPYNRNQGTSGLYDALQYARSISYVDPERIGMWGHSQAYSIIGSVLVTDGELYSLNDRMLNILHDEFGVELTEQQLSENADDIAAAALTQGQLETYQYMKQEQQSIVSRYVKAARVMDNNCCAMKTTVGGIEEVERSVHTNLMIGGERNGTSPTSATRFTQPNERYMKIFCTDGPMERNSYYQIPDTAIEPEAKSTLLGTVFDTNVTENAGLKAALDSRSVYFTFNPPTHHNGNLWSPQAISRTMEFFTQALGYNNGELTDPSTQPISCRSLASAYIALAFSTLATFALLGFLCALAGILLGTRKYASCEHKAYSPRLSLKSGDFVLAAIAATITGFVGAYFGSRETLGLKTSNAIMTRFLPTEPGHLRLIYMIIATALCGAALFWLLKLLLRKRSKAVAPALPAVRELNVKIPFREVMKTLVVALILFAAAYTLAAFLQGAFDSRFQFVDGSLELMKPYSFVRMLKYAIILLPFTLIISILNNLTGVSGVSDTADTLINVVMNSLGCWIFLILAAAITFSTPDHMTALGLHTMLPAIFLVPMCNYLYRKLYKITGSVWAGAFFAALFLGWRLAGYVSHRFMFWGYSSTVAQFFGF